MSINKAIKELTALKPSKTNKYRAYADQVLNLFKDRKIEKRKEAEKLLEQLASRGKGPQSAINKINEKYSKAESATGKLDRRELREYFVSGTTHHIITYEQKLKKAGTIKARSYKIETNQIQEQRRRRAAGADMDIRRRRRQLRGQVKEISRRIN